MTACWTRRCSRLTSSPRPLLPSLPAHRPTTVLTLSLHQTPCRQRCLRSLSSMRVVLLRRRLSSRANLATHRPVFSGLHWAFFLLAVWELFTCSGLRAIQSIMYSSWLLYAHLLEENTHLLLYYKNSLKDVIIIIYYINTLLDCFEYS